jgi:hypothetical protein
MVEDIRATNDIAMKLNSTLGLTYTHILDEIVSPLRLSLITKTRIRGLHAFNAQSGHSVISTIMTTLSQLSHCQQEPSM